MANKLTSLKMSENLSIVEGFGKGIARDIKGTSESLVALPSEHLI
jgi:hypothetical protein